MSEILLNRALALRHSITTFRKAKQLENHLGELQKVKDFYSQRLERALQVTNAYRTLIKAEIAVEYILAPDLLDWIERERAALQEDDAQLFTEELLAGRNAWGSRLKNALSAQQDLIRAAWQAWISAQVSVQNTAVLDVLQQLPSLASTVQQMLAAYAQLESLRRKAVPEPADLNKVRELATTLDNDWQQIGGHELPEDVARFLREAGTASGASFDALTPAVVAWIDERNVASSFKISFRNGRS